MQLKCVNLFLAILLVCYLNNIDAAPQIALAGGGTGAKGTGPDAAQLGLGAGTPIAGPANAPVPLGK
uniref:Uncharacterized protein n=1 Tax=Ditylenchus dipsaci TaxID=166011 RepID=A0A915DUG5_9BILA